VAFPRQLASPTTSRIVSEKVIQHAPVFNNQRIHATNIQPQERVWQDFDEQAALLFVFELSDELPGINVNQ